MISLVLFFIVLIAYIFIQNEIKRRKFPTGPYPWPIVGNIFQLDINAPEITLNKWRDIYGQIFTIWLPTPLVILADGQLMEDTFGRPGETFAGRCRSAIMDILFKGNYGLMLNENHVYKTQRRFALQTLKNFGFGRTELEPTILMTAEDSIEAELKRNGNTGKVNTKRIFAVANAGVIHKLVFGDYIADSDEVMKYKITVENVFTDWYKPSWMLLEAMPWLWWLEKLGIYNFGVSNAAKHNDVFLEFLNSNIEAHRKKRKNESIRQQPQDYADAFLDEMEKTNDQGFENWQFTIACYDLWGAGVETVTTTLQYAVLYLLHNPEIQRKLKTELREFQEPLTASNLKSLTFLNAFIQEIHRIANVIPLSLVHETLEPCEIAGYRFDTGTAVIAQLACFNLDPKIFPDPEKCVPERHISKGEFKPNKLLKPFSIGRRSCLGEALAKPQTILLLAILLKKYSIRPLDPKNLPRIFARPGLVRVPEDFDCLFVQD